jgi:hypothetical protein
MKYALTILVLAVLVLHQDTWNWLNKSLVFGFLPVGLAYHAGYAVLAAVTMAILVKFAWPKNLDEDETEATV